MTEYEQLAAQLRKPEGDFGKIVAENMNRSNAFLYKNVLNAMTINRGDYILEIGFGNGNLFSKVFEMADDILVSGLDYSADMVQAAIENNFELYNKGKLDVQQGSSDDIPYEDATFDHVFCVNVIYFWETPEKHLREIYRVLKPGGKFYAGIRPKEVMLEMPFTQYGFTLYTTNELRDLLEKNNFKTIENSTLQEPDLEFNGDTIHLQSVCVWGTK